MKIVHFITSIDRKSGGPATYMELLSTYLGKLVELHIVTANADNAVSLKNAIVHYTNCEKVSDLFILRKQWRVILDRINPDIVHLNGIWEPQSWIIQHEAQKRGIKVVITPHGMMEPWCVHHKAWKKKLALIFYQQRSIREADYLHATTEQEKKNMKLWCEETPIEVISLGIGIDNIDMKLSWVKRKKVLFLSRIHEKKGIEILFRVIQQLKDKLERYKFIIAGEGECEYIEKLKAYSHELGIEKLICFVGGVYGDAKWELYRNVDFFILPTYCENFGYVIAEALAVGTPVITTRETPWELLESNQCGYWVPLQEEAVKEAVKQMIEKTDEELGIMGRNSRRLIETQCNSSLVASRMVDLYNRIRYE